MSATKNKHVSERIRPHKIVQLNVIQFVRKSFLFLFLPSNRSYYKEKRKAENITYLKGLWRRNSNFGLRLQLSEVFGSSSNFCKFLALAPERFGPVKTKNHCIICTNRLPNKLMSVGLEPKFQAPAQANENFGYGSSHPKLLGLQLHRPAYN